MSDEASADATNPSPAGDYVRHPLLAVLRPSVVAAVMVYMLLHYPAPLTERWQMLLPAGIGLLVLSMYFWQFARHRPSFMEAAGVFLIGSGFFYVVTKASLGAAGCILLLSLAWLAMTWIARRWPLLRGLTIFAVFVFVLKASVIYSDRHKLGLEDPYRMLHGGLDLLCFFLAVFIALASSRTWHEGRLALPKFMQGRARAWTCAVFMGMLSEHVFIGPFQVRPWAFAVWGLVIWLAWMSRLWFWQVPRLRWLSPALLVMTMNQIALSIFLLYGRDPQILVAMIHAVNDFAILTLSFLATAAVWAATSGLGLQGPQLTAGKTLSAD